MRRAARSPNDVAWGAAASGAGGAAATGSAVGTVSAKGSWVSCLIVPEGRVIVSPGRANKRRNYGFSRTRRPRITSAYEKAWPDAYARPPVASYRSGAGVDGTCGVRRQPARRDPSRPRVGARGSALVRTHHAAASPAGVRHGARRARRARRRARHARRRIGGGL